MHGRRVINSTSVQLGRNRMDICLEVSMSPQVFSVVSPPRRAHYIRSVHARYVLP